MIARATRDPRPLLFVLLFVSYAYFYQAGGWNQNSRFDLVRAITNEHTLNIDPFKLSTCDKAFFEGHYYSDKAPGLALTAVPLVAVVRPVMRAFGGDPESGQTAVVEIADGGAQVMDEKAFQREMDRGAAFKGLIHRYAQAFVESLMQSVACNALHPIEKRCARCLLDIRDRVGGNEFPLTQDVLAAMLGVRRASVTLAAGALHRAGLIDHAHKSIIIRDPAGLEAAACECYARVKGHFARLLP